MVTVEDGSGLAAADSYVDVAFTDAYLLQYRRGSSWETATTQAKEDALLVAAQYLDAKFGCRWLGSRGSADQGLDWPRKRVILNGERLDESGTDSIPRDLKRAQSEMALTVLDGTDPFEVLASGAGSVKAESSELGPLKERFEYVGGARELPVFRNVALLLSRLVRPSGELNRS